MTAGLDIQKVIDQSTSQVSLSDLSRKGFTKVKVLNHAAIVRLIEEAVSRVIAERAQEISEGEKQKVVQEAESKFKELFRETTQARGAVGELQASSRELTIELEKAKVLLEERERTTKAIEARLAQRDSECASFGAKMLEADRSRDGGVRELEARAQELSARVAEKESSVASLAAELVARQKDFDTLSSELAESHRRLAGVEAEWHTEVAALQRQLNDGEKSAARLEGLMAAKDDVISRLCGTNGRQMTDELLIAVEKRLDKLKPETAVDPEIKKSIEGINQNIREIVSGSAAIRKAQQVDVEAMLKFAEKGADVSLESNFGKVGVQERQAKGVNSTLAKLRQLKDGGKEGVKDHAE